MNFRDADELVALAGEYVLGLLPPGDREDFERELAKNEKLVRAVAFWQDKLLDLVPPLDSVIPSSHLWARIERNLPRTAAPTQFRSGFWNSLKFWRFAGFFGAAASIALTWGLLMTGLANDGPRYVAVLQTPDKGAQWLVEANSTAVRLTPLVSTAIAERKALQFWTKPYGAVSPTSLGLVPTNRVTVIPASKLPALAADQLFELTLEPETGSPTGSPTGPILAVGRTIRL